MSLLKRSGSVSSFVYDEDSKSFVEDKEAAKISDQKLDGEKARRHFIKKKLKEDEAWMEVPEYIQERDWPLFQTLTSYTLDCVKQYLALKIEAAKVTSTTQSKEWVYKDLIKDMDESEVLRRLVSGKKPLPTPPPKSYYHHWYDLIDYGEGVCIEVDDKVTNFTSYPGGGSTARQVKKLRIDSEDWCVLEEIVGDNKEKSYIVQWKETPYIFKLERMTPDDFERMLNPRLRKLVTEKNYSWKLTRWEKNDNGVTGD